MIFPTPSVYAAYPLLTSIFPLVKSIFPPIPIEATPAAPSVTFILVYLALIIPPSTINPIPLYDPALPDTSAPWISISGVELRTALLTVIVAPLAAKAPSAFILSELVGESTDNLRFDIPPVVAIEVPVPSAYRPIPFTEVFPFPFISFIEIL